MINKKKPNKINIKKEIKKSKMIYKLIFFKKTKKRRQIL